MDTNTFLIAVFLTPSLVMALLFAVCIIYNFRMDRKMDRLLQEQKMGRSKELTVPPPVTTVQEQKENATLDNVADIIRNENGCTIVKLENKEP